MIGDMPTITKSAYGSHSAYQVGALNQLSNESLISPNSARRVLLAQPQSALERTWPFEMPNQEKPMAGTPPRRLVQVFIADPDENVPLDKSLLYTGSQKLTDATDQELYFEIDIQTLLKAHNELRVTLVNKKVKERTEYLEPARVRDLKMVVVDVAVF